jgi:hypothetical protein
MTAQTLHPPTDAGSRASRSHQAKLSKGSAVVPEWRILRHPPGGQSHHNANRAPRLSQMIPRQLIHAPSTETYPRTGEHPRIPSSDEGCRKGGRLGPPKLLGSSVTT